MKPVAAISNRVYSGAIGNRGYEIVKVVSSVLNHAEKGKLTANGFRHAVHLLNNWLVGGIFIGANAQRGDSGLLETNGRFRQTVRAIIQTVVVGQRE